MSLRRSSPPRPAPKLLPREHTALALSASSFFNELAVSVTLVDETLKDPEWHAIHVVPHVGVFETEHGFEVGRSHYNRKLIGQAVRTRRLAIGEYAGFTDYFMPVVRGGRPGHVLVAGPFRTAPPTSAEIHEHWRELSRIPGQLTEPEFARYVSMWLSTARLDQEGGQAFGSFMACLAAAIAGEADPVRLSRELAAAQADLSPVTFLPELWEAVRALLDPRTSRVWQSFHYTPWRRKLGIERAPEHVAVGLIAADRTQADPVDALIRRHEYQRACAALTASVGDAAAGPVGQHGVALLISSQRSEARTRARLHDLVERAISLGRRRFQLKVHFGVGSSSGSGSLPVRYQEALAAAERALSQGTRIVAQAPDTQGRSRSFRELRVKLGTLASDPRGSLGTHFDRFGEAAAAHSRYRLDLTAAHLEAGFERVAEPLLASGVLDARGFEEVCEALERAAEHASTVGELLSSYSIAAADLERALRRPAASQQARSLQRALSFMRERAVEKLSLEQVARVAGFEPEHFSRLFKRQRGMKFEAYLSELRLERAKRLLTSSSLDIERVARLSGFSTGSYLCRVFKRAVGETPLRYRAVALARQSKSSA